MPKITEVSTMRDSFYSTSSNLTNKFKDAKGSDKSSDNRVIDGFKLKNVLEFNEEEKKIIEQIKMIMNEECERLQDDIDSI